MTGNSRSRKEGLSREPILSEKNAEKAKDADSALVSAQELIRDRKGMNYDRGIPRIPDGE